MGYRDGLGQGWRVGAKALERMIDECSGDAHRWLDVLNDLMDARAALDATRAKLAEVERERDAAVERAYWRGSSEALVDTPWGSVEGVHKALAAWQAECARLREAMRYMEAAFQLVLSNKPCTFVDEALSACDAALASAPGSTDALREVCERVVRRLWVERDAHEHAYKRQGVMFDASAFVSRILGERGKEGGDA